MTNDSSKSRKDHGGFKYTKKDLFSLYTILELLDGEMHKSTDLKNDFDKKELIEPYYSGFISKKDINNITKDRAFKRLINENILKSEVSKSDKPGQNPIDYKLNKSPHALKNILKNIYDGDLRKKDKVTIGLKILDSAYGEKIVTLELVENINDKIIEKLKPHSINSFSYVIDFQLPRVDDELNLDKRSFFQKNDVEFVFNVIRTSPSALYSFLDTYLDIPTSKNADLFLINMSQDLGLDMAVKEFIPLHTVKYEFSIDFDVRKDELERFNNMGAYFSVKRYEKQDRQTSEGPYSRLKISYIKNI